MRTKNRNGLVREIGETFCTWGQPSSVGEAEAAFERPQLLWGGGERERVEVSSRTLNR